MLRRVLFLMLCLFPFGWSQQASAMLCCQTDCNENNGGFEVYGEYLYWKAVQDQMAYAGTGLTDIFGSDNPFPTGASKAKIVEPHFKYHSGFRVGVGYQLPCTYWDTQVAWTRLHDTNSSSVSQREGVFPFGALISIFGSSSENGPGLANEARSHWHFAFDTVDLQLGRTLESMCNLFFRPYIGARIASIRQKQNTAFFGLVDGDTGAPIDASVSRKNLFRGVGPSIGIDGSLKFCSQWSLNGGVSGALLYGRLDTHNIITISENGQVGSIDLKNREKYRLRPNANTYFGLGWESCFCEKYQVKLGVSYEMQYWWNQWDVPGDLVGVLFTGGDISQGDLMLHGITARAQIAF